MQSLFMRLDWYRALHRNLQEYPCVGILKPVFRIRNIVEYIVSRADVIHAYIRQRIKHTKVIIWCVYEYENLIELNSNNNISILRFIYIYVIPNTYTELYKMYIIIFAFQKCVPKISSCYTKSIFCPKFGTGNEYVVYVIFASNFKHSIQCNCSSLTSTMLLCQADFSRFAESSLPAYILMAQGLRPRNACVYVRIPL